MRFAVVVVGAGLLVACRSSTPSGLAPVDAAAAASRPTPTCTSPIVVRAEIHGAFKGQAGSGMVRPVMVVGMDHAPPFGLSGRSFGTVAELELEAPRFAAEYGPADLCSDDGSTSDRIAISCITGPSAKVTKLTVARADSGLVATIDGKQTRWEPPKTEASSCFELHGLDGKRDLEALRKAWMLDEPRCQRSSSSQPLTVTLRLDPVAEAGHHDAKVTLLGAGAPRDVGKMTNMSGAVGFRRSPDVNGIMVSASDMGVDRRFAYQLGDRVYYVSEDGRVHAADLPCGARAKFEVRAAAPLQVPELP